MEEDNMIENLEIEFKILLTKKLYYKMLLDFETKESREITQTNHYFETPTKDLKKNHLNIRVREIDSTYELTLKKKERKTAKKEFNALITKDQFESLKRHKVFQHPIFDLVKDKIDLEELTYFCSLQTSRIEVPFGCGVLCFDQNSYFDHIDYELEYEVTNEEQGKKEFLELIESYGLEYHKNCISKTARAFNALYLSTNEL